MPTPELLSAAEAVRLLGIKPATLYAYVSRGALRALPGPDGRRSHYPREDVLRLKARHDARSGHGAVAAGALVLGEAVLDSELCAITPDGPAYRGVPALDLVSQPLERVAAALWTSQPGPASPVPAALSAGTVRRWSNVGRLPRGSRPIMGVRALATWAWMTGGHAQVGAAPEVTLGHAGELLRLLAAAPALVAGAGRFRAACRAPGVAKSLLVALGGRPTSKMVEAMNAALVLCADHELNASAFAARVAAGTGADLHACIVAALATHSGPLHGGACDRVEALIGVTPAQPRAAERMLRERVHRGESVPGFGHPLYPAGDPRAVPLVEWAVRLGKRRPGVVRAVALQRAARSVLGQEASLDLGLVALCAAMGLPAGSAVCVFAVGRVAGWMAHALEQQRSGQPVRPRARYVGPAVSARVPRRGA